eukprot:gene48610-59525_t
MDRGWNWLRADGALARWQALGDADATLRHRLPGAGGRFALRQPGLAVTLDFTDGQLRLAEGGEAPTVFSADATTWERFLQPVPPRHHQNLLAMRMRVPDFSAEGDQLAWAQHVHLIRRVLDLGRWL